MSECVCVCVFPAQRVRIFARQFVAVEFDEVPYMCERDVQCNSYEIDAVAIRQRQCVGCTREQRSVFCPMHGQYRTCYVSCGTASWYQLQ